MDDAWAARAAVASFPSLQTVRAMLGRTGDEHHYRQNQQAVLGPISCNLLTRNPASLKIAKIHPQLAPLLLPRWIASAAPRPILGFVRHVLARQGCTGRAHRKAIMNEPQETKSSRRGSKTGVGMAAGIAMGIAIGVAMNNIGVGLALGLALGAGLGAAMGRRQSSD